MVKPHSKEKEFDVSLMQDSRDMSKSVKSLLVPLLMQSSVEAANGKQEATVFLSAFVKGVYGLCVRGCTAC